MGVVTIIDGSVAHTVNLSGPRPAGHRWQAVVLLHAVDELTGDPVRTPLTVTTRTPGLAGRGATGGVAGLVGVPSRAFPELGTRGYDVDVRIEARGYTPWVRTLTVPARAAFPDAFAGLAAGRVDLVRRPVTIEVHAFRLTPQGATVPVGGADLEVTAIWRTVADIPLPGLAARFVSLPHGTSQHWPAGTALDSVSLVPVAEPVRTLAHAAAPGDDRIVVDRAGGLSPGDLVGLDLADPDRREYLTTAAVPAGDPESPAQLALVRPVRVAHAAGGVVRRLNPPPPAPADTTTTEVAGVGDATVFVTDTGSFGTVEILRAAGPTIDTEYVDSHLFRATTTATGVARLPALSRVAAVQVTATRGALSATTAVSPDHVSPVTTVGLTLR